MEPTASALVTAFQGLSTDLASDLGTVAIAAVGIMVLFIGWNLGKKLFKSVAK